MKKSVRRRPTASKTNFGANNPHTCKKMYAVSCNSIVQLMSREEKKRKQSTLIHMSFNSELKKNSML